MLGSCGHDDAEDGFCYECIIESLKQELKNKEDELRKYKAKIHTQFLSGFLDKLESGALYKEDFKPQLTRLAKLLTKDIT